MYRKAPEAPKQPFGRIFDGDTAEGAWPRPTPSFCRPFVPSQPRDARLTKVRQYRVHVGSNQN